MAIIDGDRAVFGDPEFEFASSWTQNPSLLKGYGVQQKKTTQNQKIRKELYELFYMLMECYVGFAEYNNKEMYESNREKILDFSKKNKKITNIF